jgi:hypothetical protein
MHRFSRLIRGVLIPMAALTILVSSAVPASASSAPTVAKVTKPIVKTLSINW